MSHSEDAVTGKVLNHRQRSINPDSLDFTRYGANQSDYTRVTMRVQLPDGAVHELDFGAPKDFRVLKGDTVRFENSRSITNPASGKIWSIYGLWGPFGAHVDAVAAERSAELRRQRDTSQQQAVQLAAERRAELARQHGKRALRRAERFHKRHKEVGQPPLVQSESVPGYAKLERARFWPAALALAGFGTACCLALGLPWFLATLAAVVLWFADRSYKFVFEVVVGADMFALASAGLGLSWSWGLAVGAVAAVGSYSIVSRLREHAAG